MKRIDISTKGHPNIFTLVDDEDYEYLNQWKWYLVFHKRPRFTMQSVERMVYKNGKAKGKIKIHRVIIKARKGVSVDHIDGDVLNNQKNNLRLCTNQQNQFNSRSRTGISRYKGVTYIKNYNNWKAQIMHNGKTIYLGIFEDEKIAALAYNKKAVELFGEFSSLNKI